MLTLDRGGDFLSTTLALGEGTRMSQVAQVRSPHSLGEVYSALTWYLGFAPNADEGKVMGLAPYGSDRLVDELADLVHLDGPGLFRVNLGWFGYQREATPVGPRFIEHHGPPRRPESELTDRDKDLAFALQAVTEEAGVHVARALRRVSPSGNLCLAGGVALNSVMNRRLLTETGFDRVFVQPLASDAGNALGAALSTWHDRFGGPRVWAMEHAFWGATWSGAEMAAPLTTAGLPTRQVRDPGQEAAALLAAGQVVGWFQGRAEVGPRALGARSILADPRRAEMRDVVNARVKRREWFRPFAPSVLAEHGPDWFEGYVPTPFMTMVLPIRAEQRDRIPAVTHVDGTGRLQSVSAATDPAFHGLISRFLELTGVPVVLNTSFNVRGEPIVHRPEEALADFLASDMDALVMGDAVVRKSGEGGTPGGDQ